MTPDELADIYRDLHEHPELSYEEVRTAGIVAGQLTDLGFTVRTGVGGTGVVGVLENGDGPTVVLRADMDALPVAEDTGLPYASTATVVSEDGARVPVMHACGHDVHVTCLLGACSQLADDRGKWSGTIVAVFQQGEERAGARRMIDAGLVDLIPNPTVVLGQHVAPLPAGLIGLAAGPAFAASDQVTVVMRGRGSHGSRPEASIDPIVMAAAVVMRLQTIVSREVSPVDEPAVVTVGQIFGGQKENIISDSATLKINVRSYSEDVRERVLASIARIARGEAIASGATEEPIVEVSEESFPVLVNDADAVERTVPALAASGAMVVDPGPVSGSEDVGMISDALGVPIVYWLLGGLDPAEFVGASSVDEIKARIADLPANHSPEFAPVIEQTLTNGVAAFVAAAREWLG